MKKRQKLKSIKKFIGKPIETLTSRDYYTYSRVYGNECTQLMNHYYTDSLKIHALENRFCHLVIDTYTNRFFMPRTVDISLYALEHYPERFKVYSGRYIDLLHYTKGLSPSCLFDYAPLRKIFPVFDVTIMKALLNYLDIHEALEHLHINLSHVEALALEHEIPLIKKPISLNGN